MGTGNADSIVCINRFKCFFQYLVYIYGNHIGIMVVFK